MNSSATVRDFRDSSDLAAHLYATALDAFH